MPDQRINLDPADVLAAYRAKAAQLMTELQDENARLSVYCSMLEKRLAELETPPAA